MPDRPVALQKAEVVARALVDRGTDMNECAKVATYARTHLSGRQFFRLIDTMVKDGRYLVRSGQTLDYYHNLQEVCRQHLEAYRNAQGDQAVELAEILGWTVRLMRYYQGAGTAPGERRPSQPRRPVPTTGTRSPETPSTTIKSAFTKPTVIPQRQETTTREVVTLVEDVKNRKALVEMPDGERIVCADLPVYPPQQKGQQCRADVVRRDGKAVRATFKRWE